MSKNTEYARKICGAAIVLGILADLLLREGPWGINFFLWISMLIGALAWLASRQPPEWPDDAKRMLWVALFFGFAIAWRDTIVLKLLAVFTIGLTLSIPALRTMAGGIRRSGVTDQIAAMAFTGLSAGFGSALLSRDAELAKAPKTGWQAKAVPILRGIVIAIPVLLIFGALFASADAAFAAVISKVFDIEWLFGHIAIIIFATWIIGGFLYGSLSGIQVPTIGEKQFGRGSLGIIEVGTVLGLLAALFAAFIIVQIRYYFGGEAIIQATTGLTYAEYARSGFFELVFVSALVLPILLSADWMLRRQNRKQERIFRILAGIQLILLFAVMASALYRMVLYMNSYGLTDDRFYATVFIIWLAVVFIWFSATVLMKKRERFAFGALVAVWITAASLFAVNPEAIIVRVNADRVEAGYEFDAEYAVRLSADSVPALIEALPSLSEKDKCILTEHLLSRWSSSESRDWRTFSISRWNAKRAVQSHTEYLQEFSCLSKPKKIPGERFDAAL